MSLREEIARELDGLTDAQLERVAHYLTLVKTRRSGVGGKDLNETQLAALYGEFAEEDEQLAEQGMEDYADALAKEDTK